MERLTDKRWDDRLLVLARTFTGVRSEINSSSDSSKRRNSMPPIENTRFQSILAPKSYGVKAVRVVPSGRYHPGRFLANMYGTASGVGQSGLVYKLDPTGSLTILYTLGNGGRKPVWGDSDRRQGGRAQVGTHAVVNSFSPVASATPDTAR